MKAILKFDLNDPDDTREFHLASKAKDYQLFVWSFSEDVLRRYYRYGLPKEITNTEELLEHLRAEFRRLFEEYKLDDPL